MNKFLDSIWACWLGLFLITLIQPELFVLVVLAFGVWCLWKIIRVALRLLGATLRRIGLKLDRWNKRRQNRRFERQLEREWKRNRPVEEARQRARSEARKRREDARAACELLYGFYESDIKDRFPRALFADYLAKYMGENQTPEYAEERGLQLQAMIHRHVERLEPGPKFKTLPDLAAWFLKQKQEIESLPEGIDKDILYAHLNARYAQLTTQLLEEMQP